MFDEGGKLDMNKLKLLFLGILPFAIGRLLDYAMMKYNWYGTIISIIGIMFFSYWFFVEYKSYDYVKTAKESILIGNSFAIISIILILFQGLILKRFMPNILGILPQMFYLPTLGVIGTLERTLLFFVSTHYLWMSFVLSFILMIVVYYAGYHMRLKNKRT